MRFPNAEKGVKKIFTAEILGLLSAICLVAAAVTREVVGALTKASGTIIIVATVTGIAALLLMLLSYVLNIVGISQASKDEDAFRISLYVAIFGIVFSLLSGFLGNAFEGNAYAQRIISVIPDLVNLCMMVYVVIGIRNLAVQLSDPVMEGKGQNILRTVFVMEIIIFVVRAFSGMIQTDAAAMIAIACLGFAGILSIVTYVLYLAYLSKARKMLARA